MRPIIVLLLFLFGASAWAATPACNGIVFEDRNGDGHRDPGEAGLSRVMVSDGVELVPTDAQGRYELPLVDGRTVFVIKPAGHAFRSRGDGTADHWRNIRTQPGPALKYGGIPVGASACGDFGLVPRASSGPLRVRVFADPQVKSVTDVGYYDRDIIASVLQAGAQADLGLSLGDIVNDDLSLYPALNAKTARLRMPWLHVAGNHDLDFDAARDEDSLLTFRNVYGPDSFAWEEAQAVFIGLDDVVYLPGSKPEYIGGLREDQFAFLAKYLPTVPRDRLLVLGMHIPLFDAEQGRETFRRGDRERLFAMLRGFPHVLVLSGHSHTQRHFLHDAANGWHGSKPLHEYNVGAACGAFWSGVRDTQGIPDTTMSDGTPNGFATLEVEGEGRYRLQWHPARDIGTQMVLHAPKVLRRGAWPGSGVHANVFMGRNDTRVEYRIDDGEWKPMQRVVQPDPRVVAENARDDEATALRGYDRAPEAKASQHLWRGTLPTDLAVGEHRIAVRAFGVDPKREIVTEEASYRVVQADN